MSAPSKTPSVEYRHNVARGRHELGVRVDGGFVPFVTVDDARYAQLVENETNATEAGDDNGNEDA